MDNMSKNKKTCDKLEEFLENPDDYCKLDLRNNKLYKYTREQLDQMYDILMTNETITVLNMGAQWNFQEAYHLKMIPQIFVRNSNTKIAEIYLHSSHITNKYARELLDGLKVAEERHGKLSVTKVLLTKNKVENDTIEEINGFLLANNSIVEEGEVEEQRYSDGDDYDGKNIFGDDSDDYGDY